MPSGSTDTGLDQAIRLGVREKRLVEFRLHGLQRIGEPHVYGVHKGVPQLLIYQVGGESQSGSLPDWRRANLPEITAFHLLDQTFSASRSIPTGRHGGWDEIFVTVS